ncbi:LOW QUALITY PROTEIN: nuclear pore complex protein NUP43 [Dioscorea cayenensis subsp. rotundata]|uniref:LOW QUALITY PROTEIN: nuclear pore complex protein NUP43 n=1 Tax=Dioscorea cayennensis subsp. rotundata TaxID=55577 RepID=A0AB40BXG2_DIOCR|nr:LOW QUALITY PROTEIN: nuclear pore complex protein NUP43 [Dioscorea cayenensis subsp. rotundata]
MAIAGDPNLHRFPQPNPVDAVRWIPAFSSLRRFAAAAVHDPDSSSSAVEVHALNPGPNLVLRSSHPIPSRISALRFSLSPQKPLLATAATSAGSLHLLSIDPFEGSIDSELSVSDIAFSAATVADVDGQMEGREWVSVGEDGRVNLVAVGDGRLEWRRVFDSMGLVEYSAVKWGSPAEFATGGLGFGVQWWDQRKPGGAVAQFKGNWACGNTIGMVHSIDIHPSRKHICVVGASSGTVFAWDLRWQHQPILLSGVGMGDTVQPTSESEVWEVRYDTHIQSSSIATGPTRILPVMMCSEDGILAVLEQGEEPVELLAEACAINGFDIDPQNPSDVICTLEWEMIGILPRSRETSTAF